MKKVYIAMKFNRDKSKIGLENQLEKDLRSLLLGDKKLIVEPTYPQIPGTNFIYNGPYYCESAGEGAAVTCTDCQVIVAEELKALDSSDLFICYLGKEHSVGTITELIYCATHNIPTVIIYNKKETKYDMKSDYWFAIVAAMQLNPNVTSYCLEDRLTPETLKEILLHKEDK